MSDAATSEHLELLRQQTVLAKFGKFALRSEDFGEILAGACHLVGEALGTDLARVMELQEDGESLLVRAGVGWKAGVADKMTLKTRENSSEGSTLKTGESMISPNTAQETRFNYPPFLCICEANPDRPHLAVVDTTIFTKLALFLVHAVVSLAPTRGRK